MNGAYQTKNGFFSYRAKPGYLVAYGTTHIGIVEKIEAKLPR